jgi:hypothetical protein
MIKNLPISLIKIHQWKSNKRSQEKEGQKALKIRKEMFSINKSLMSLIFIQFSKKYFNKNLTSR